MKTSKMANVKLIYNDKHEKNKKHDNKLNQSEMLCCPDIIVLRKEWLGDTCAIYGGQHMIQSQQQAGTKQQNENNNF